MIRSLIDRTIATPWSHGGKIPWHDRGFSERMLREHLSQVHDRASRRFSVIDEHVAWIHDRVLEGKSSRVLDLGCGPGFYASRLAARGHSVLGVDISPASIEHAKAEAKRDGLGVEYILADITSAKLGGPYDVALLLYGELNAFAPEVAIEVLSSVANTMAPGGRMVLELHTEEGVRANGIGAPTWSTYESSVFADIPHLVLRECSWHEAESASVERYFVLEEGASDFKVMASTTQAYTPDGYLDLLRSAGLVELQRHPCLTGQSTADDPNLFVIIAGVGNP